MNVRKSAKKQKQNKTATKKKKKTSDNSMKKNLVFDLKQNYGIHR